jgi:acid stress-induced BolA-like protein IbaG/YrbA
MRLESKIEEAIRSWAKENGVILSKLEVYPSGIGSNIHVIVVAESGLEPWSQIEREQKIYDYLKTKLLDAERVRISLLLALTDDEDSRYARFVS